MADEQWISVEERLPEEVGMYLVFRQHGKFPAGTIHSGSFQQRRWGYVKGGKLRFATGVTHWMPLPDPPTVKRETGGDHGRSRD